ncbi:MAG: CIA30 family protein [Cyclobacteriaceae bacterium]
MKILFGVLNSVLFIFNASMTIDFGENKTGTEWEVISDGVMGGRSKGFTTMKENTLTFEGTVSLANNGGFSSFKSPFKDYDLSAFEVVEIKYRAEGQAFAMTLETDQRWYMPYFKKQFTGKTTEWQTVRIPLSEFQQYRVGSKTGKTLSDENLSQIVRIGITTDSKKESQFVLELDYLRFE